MSDAVSESFSRFSFWFVASSYEFDEINQLDHQIVIYFPLIDSLFCSYLIKATDHSLAKETVTKLNPSSTGVAFQAFLARCSPNIPSGLVRQ